MTRELAILVVVWVLIGGCAGVLALQLGGGRVGPIITPIQVLTPWLLPVVLAVVLLAVARQHWVPAAAGSAVLIAYLVLIAPLVVHPTLPPASGVDRLSVLHANVLYENRSFDRSLAVIEAADVDVIAVSELTPEFADRIEASTIGERYPYHVLLPKEAALGLGIWSKRPLTPAQLPGAAMTLVADLELDGRPLRLVLTHPIPPLYYAEAWQNEVEALIGQDRLTTERSLIVGDLNVSYFNPAFRRMLADTGMDDAHIALGKGFGTSWPTDRWWLPAFVRLDHALLGDDVTATAIDDLDMPGSDHRAFVVTVAWSVTG